jgi:transcriptional regulator with XRE-family HTH domain
MDSFAEALRALMHERDISGRALASLVPCDKGHLSRMTRGLRRPSKGLAARLDELLEAGGGLAALVPPARPPRAASRPDRRAVLARGAVSLLGLPDALDRLAWAERNPPRLDAAAVAALADVLAGQRRADDMLGSAVIMLPALAQLATIESLVRRAGGAARRPLLDVAQQQAQFTAWLCRNTADPAGAATRHGQTLEWAAELGDRTMIAQALTDKAEMAAYQGEAGVAVGLAQAAQRDPRAAAGQRAMAAMFEARGHAMTGDRAAAERTLNEGRRLAAAFADRPADKRPWSYWMAPAYFRNHAGITCAYLAADPRWHAHAVALLADDATAPGLWAPAQNLAYLAYAHAQARDVTEACAAALKAMDAARLAGSARLTPVLAQVHAALRARYPGNAQVAELAQAIRSDPA